MVKTNKLVAPFSQILPLQFLGLSLLLNLLILPYSLAAHDGCDVPQAPPSAQFAAFAAESEAVRYASQLTLPLARGIAPPQKITKVLNGVTFNSDYDNGSLLDVTWGGGETYNCSIYNEPGVLGSRRYWFRFTMANVAGRNMTINIEHNQNRRPFIRINNGPWRRMTNAESSSTTAPLLLNFGLSDTTAELSFFEPLGFTETYAEVDALVAASPYAAQQNIGTSFQGRNLRMVTVNDPRYPDASKHRVWIHSRAHAGEVTSTHTMLGMLEEVTATTDVGRRLRQNLIVNIVPLLNVDGTALGHTRWDSQGIDPEREWCDVQLSEVQAMKNQVDAFMAGPNPIEVALNLHSTVSFFTDTFFFKHLFPSVSRNFEVIQQNYIDAFDNATPLFDNLSAQSSQLSACIFIESYFWNNWGEDVMALTHEGHYWQRITDGGYITGEDYREIGRAQMRGLVEYFDMPPLIADETSYSGFRLN